MILAQQFGGSCSKFFLGCSFKGEFQGLTIRITYQPPRKNTPAYLRISLEKRTRLKLRVYRESAISRLGEKMGLVREVKTGDEQFDNDFLIFSNNKEQAEIYLSSFDKKNIVKELFKRGFDELIMDGKRLLVSKPYSFKNDSVEDLSILKVQEILDILFKLTSGFDSNFK